MVLYHVSEQAAIERFDPRPSEILGVAVVWAIDAERLRNYLLPRDCPRVTFYAGPQTTPEDATCFLGTSHAVVALEYGWLERVRRSRLYCYRLPPESFESVDNCAGYHISRTPVTPLSIDVVDDAVGALIGRGVELRIVRNLWPLRNAVVASSLQFSMIRMKNALPPLADVTRM